MQTYLGKNATTDNYDENELERERERERERGHR